MTTEERAELEAAQRELNKRTMQPIAASVLMKVLYMARMARYDLLRATCRLATMFTKWTEECDVRLHRLMCYLKQTPHYRLVGYVGDKPEKLGPCLWTDADLGGCGMTARSSSGVHLAIRGPNTMFPLNSIFKRQTCTATATAEAEFVAASFGNRNELMPILDLCDVILPSGYQALFLEDNQAMIRIVKTGRNRR